MLSVLSNSSYNRRDLLEEVTCAESTLDRGLRQLEDAGLIQYRDGQWELTKLGYCTYRQYKMYTEGLNDIVEAAPMLLSLSPDTPLSEKFLRCSESFEAEPNAPDLVLSHLFKSVEQARQIRGLVPKVLFNAINPFYETATTGANYEIELVFERDVYDSVYSHYSDELQRVLQDPQISLLRGSVPFSFGLWIADNAKAGVIIYTDCGVRGLIVNDTTEALKWAESTYIEVKEQAEPILLRGGSCRNIKQPIIFE